MTEELIVKCCAPTLAGLKPGSIVCLSHSCMSVPDELEKCRRILKTKGVEVRLCEGCKGQQLIYLYRPEALDDMMAKKCNACLLRRYGYNTEDVQSAVDCLLDRIRHEEEFPHEIGLFLGYPYEDVAGYIENKGKNYVTDGLWRVYGNKDNAKKRFDSYKKCTRVYIKCYKNGFDLDRLTVQKQPSRCR